MIIVVLNNEFISSFYYKSLGTAFSHKAGGPGNKEHFFALTGMAQLVGASSHGLKGQEFNSQSGHMTGLWASPQAFEGQPIKTRSDSYSHNTLNSPGTTLCKPYVPHHLLYPDTAGQDALGDSSHCL